MANVLIVDDRRENLVALEAILEPLGHTLVPAGSGEEALRQLLTHEFAVILMDVQMPGLDGFETAELIKRRERTRHVPILFLTAVGKDARHVFRGYSAGAVDYIFKPFEPEILRSKVAVFIDLYEKTEQLRRREEELREHELAELRRAGERRYRNLADAMPQIVWTATAEGQANYVNRRWYEYTGLTPDETREPGSWQRVLHPDDVEPALARWREAVAAGEPFELQYRLRRTSDSTYRWHLGRALPTRDESGAITAWVGTSTDIDDQKRAEEAQAFVLEAGAVLASSLDYRSTLKTVTELAVPQVADWCAIDVVEEDGRLRHLSVAHVDPAKVQLADELRRRYPSSTDAGTGPARVVDSGEPELVEVISDEMLTAAAADQFHLALLSELGLRSYMCVPLSSRGRTLGAITFVSAESGRRFDASDLTLAQELARLAAAAVDNAHLYEEAENRAQAARALASVADGVFLLDGEGLVRLWNPAAEAITGLPESSVLGRPADEVIPGWSDVSVRVPLASAGQGARPESVPLELDGRELWLSITGVEAEDGAVYAFRDLTEERALERMKSDFVATVSHELRTPLAAIYGSALTIRRPDLDLDDGIREQLLQVIADESDRLARIVNDLLLASHLDSGRLPLEIESTDASELARAVLDSARTHLPDNVSLELELPGELPPVAADPTQLRQVLVNLVDNAIKYSPDGGPVLVRLERLEGNVRFAVDDSGLGIPRGQEGRIFEKFYRLDPNMTRGIGGTGLGLYICRELVRRVGGRIWVESGTGAGSTFYVEIPIADAPAARPRKRSRSRPARGSPRARSR